MAGFRHSDCVGAEITFAFDSVPIVGLEGDTVASALIANGILALGTSPISGDPYRGFCLVGRCAECLMTIDGQPGTMACATPLVAGMQVRTQQGRGNWDES